MSIDLSRRLVACSRFRWMPGMRTQHGERVLLRLSGGRLLVQPDDVQHEDGRNIETEGPCVVRVDDGGPRQPDLTDPATLGCLLALVREATNDPAVYYGPTTMIRADGTSPMWFVYTGRSRGPIGTGATEAEALVVALECAP